MPEKSCDDIFYTPWANVLDNCFWTAWTLKFLKQCCHDNIFCRVCRVPFNVYQLFHHVGMWEAISICSFLVFFFLGHLLTFLPNEKWKTPSNIDLLNPPSSPRGMGAKYGNVCEVKTFEALLYFLICLTKNIHDKNKEAKCCMWLGRCILNA